MVRNKQKIKFMKKTLLILIAVIASFSCSAKCEDSTVTEFNPKNLLVALREAGIAFPELVWAQSKVESGNWKSGLFKNNNNLFGMRKAKVRKTTAIGSRKGYAKYISWIECVKDYKLWQEMHHITEKTTKREYLKLLNKVYCSIPGYSKEVLKNLNKIKKYELSV